MPVNIKSPNPDDIWDAWKRKNVKTQSLEKHYGIKGAVFKLDDISAAEFVKDVHKATLIYFEVETKITGSGKKGKLEKIPVSKMEGSFISLQGLWINPNGKGIMRFHFSIPSVIFLVKLVVVRVLLKRNAMSVTGKVNAFYNLL
jgi:hypothetical protein